MLVERFSNIEFIKGKESVGITINLSSESEYSIDYVWLVKKKNIISIQDLGNNISDINSLNNTISGKTPIHLNIIGKGLIHRKLEKPAIEDKSEKEIIHNIFPNADPEEFLLQKTTTKQGFYLSLIRKKIVEEILNHFTSIGFFITHITIGPFAINNITGLFENIPINSPIYVKNQKLEIDDQLISSINLTQNKSDVFYTIGDENINHDNLISFASAFSFYIPSKNSFIELEQLNISKEEFTFKKVFTLLGWGILIFVFTVLLINYLFFEHYNKKYNTLSLEYSNRIEVINSLQKLSTELAEKERFVSDNNLQVTSRFSYYSDRLAILIPKGIVLQELILNPLISNIKKNKEISVAQNIILVNGQVAKTKLLNNWIKEIEKENWVKDVKIVKFSQKDQNSSAEFELEISVKESIKRE